MGGTILGTGYENAAQFEAGFMKFVKEVQPGAEFTELPKEHFIYKRWHKIRSTYGLWATHTEKGNRPVALLIKKPFAVPLSTRRGTGSKAAMELGTNIVISLTQIDKRRNFLDDVMMPKKK